MKHDRRKNVITYTGLCKTVHKSGKVLMCSICSDKKSSAQSDTYFVRDIDLTLDLNNKYNQCCDATELFDVFSLTNIKISPVVSLYICCCNCYFQSGKLVMKMFQKIQEFIEDRDSLVFVLIDEVGLLLIKLFNCLEIVHFGSKNLKESLIEICRI